MSPHAYAIAGLTVAGIAFLLGARWLRRRAAEYERFPSAEADE